MKKEIERQRKTEKEKERQRKTEKDRERQRKKQKDRERKRDLGLSKFNLGEILNKNIFSKLRFYNVHRSEFYF